MSMSISLDLAYFSKCCFELCNLFYVFIYSINNVFPNHLYIFLHVKILI